MESAELPTDFEKMSGDEGFLARTYSVTTGSIGNNFTGFAKVVETVRPYFTRIVNIILLILWHAYLVVAGIHDFNSAAVLIYFTAFCWVCFLISWITKTTIYDNFSTKFAIKFEELVTNIRIVSVGSYVAIILGILAFVVIEALDDLNRLRGFCGYAFYLIFMFVFSNNRRKINWRIVASCFIMHSIVAIVIMRWSTGKWFFKKVSEVVVQFLSYAQDGAAFVYGFVATPPNICDLNPVFIFTALQTLIYFGAIVAVLFYFGAIQVVLLKLAWLMRVLIGTTPVESLNAWACTFLGMTEGPLVIAPYVEKLTRSELHAVLTSGFACIAGTLFAAYTQLGACPEYLLSASLMSAPCSLGCSKMMFPETEESQVTEDDIIVEHESQSGVLETLSQGATNMVSVVFCIGANLVAVMGLLALLDDVIGYLGDRVGLYGWTFQLIVGYIFFPLSYLMGVTESTEETLLVAELMGTKTAVNEFVAYRKLGDLQNSGKLSPRAAMIATYALCGFSNFSSTGMQIEFLGSFAPKRKSDIAGMVMRALCAGAIACFLNATVAGILVENPDICSTAASNSTCYRIPNTV